MTWLEEYGTAVLDNKIVACKRIKQVYEKLLNNLHNPSEYHFDEDIANKHINFIEKFCKQPTGKLGTPLKLELFQKAKFQAIFGFVDDNNLRQYNEALTIEGRKCGKALALDTLIPTPNGWKKIIDINIGDSVFGVDGKPYKVVTVSDIFYNHKCYKVTFEDGSDIICDSQHIWTVKNKKNKILNKTTDQLLHFKRIRKDKKGTEYLYRIPMSKPVEYGEKELIINPYVLGVWLGDGSSYDTRITCDDKDIKEMQENLEKCGVTTKIYKNKNRASSLGIDVVGLNKPNKTLNNLRDLNLLKNKHIPDIYMMSSVEQRLELLRGLMDTDGYCAKNAQCEFSQKNHSLILQVQELLSSLGIKNSIKTKYIMCNNKRCKSYSVYFFTNKNFSCFKLKRKHERLKDTLNKRMDWKSITNIEEIKSVPCKCIGIDSKDHLYLAGKSFTATHNTTEMAAVALAMLVNDGEGAPEIYNIATALDQSKKGFTETLKMVKQSPLLSKHLKKRQSDIYFAYNMGFIKALASNSNSLDGLNGHLITIDELAAIKNRDIYDLMKQSMSARSQPLLFCITTNGFVRDNIFDSQYEYACGVLDGTIIDKKFLPFIYELDDIKEWDKPDMWIKANPGLGTIKSFDFLRDCVEKAKKDPAFKPTVLVKDFNLKQNSASAWLRWEELNNEEKFDYKFRYCIGGFDAADSVDLNAAKAICQRRGDDNLYIKSMYWIPETVLDKVGIDGSRRERDNAPYDLWVKQGLMRTHSGNKVEKRVFLEWFKELRDNEDIYPLYIGYDPWHISDELLEEFRGEFGSNVMIPIRQGAITQSQPLFDLKADFEAHRIIYNNNPVDKMCLMNSEVRADINGNIQLVKTNDARKRIDGTAALLDAYIVLQDRKTEYQSLI